MHFFSLKRQLRLFKMEIAFTHAPHEMVWHVVLFHL